MTPLKKAKKKANDDFSLWIRERDRACVRCGKTERLSNSHFWVRQKWNTRFDPENCDALCYHCHKTWEHEKQGEYMVFKIKQLGKERYDALEERAQISIKHWIALEQCGEVVHGARDYYYAEVVKWKPL